MRIIRYILWFLIILLILAILGNLIFGGKDPDTTTTEVATQSSFVESASTNSSVTFVMAGIINGTEMHRSIRITVTKGSRTLDIIEGYSGTVLSTQTYANNQEAYREFLSSLYTSGFTKENPENTNPDISGRCPLGNRFIYTSSEITNVPDELWTTSCKTVIGTFGGDANSVNQLFRLQIPNYSQQTASVNLAQN